MRKFLILLLAASHCGLAEGSQVDPVIWRSEAESFSASTGSVSSVSALNAESLNVSDNAYASFGANSSSITFDAVQVAEAGGLRLTLSCWNSSATSVQVFLNGTSAGSIALDPFITSSAGRGKASHLTLSPGIGTHQIRLVGDAGLQIDYALLTRPQATTYYISQSDGDDDNDGLSELTAFASLEKISTVDLFAGDQVRLKSGDTFLGLFSVNGSGADGAPIVISRYGSGAQPIIDGASAQGGSHGQAIYLNNVSFIEISDIHVTNDRSVSHPFYLDTVGYGIFVHNNAHSVMEHFHFDHITVDGVFAVSTSGVEFNKLKVAGIYFRSEKNEVGNPVKHIRDVEVSDSYFTRTGKFGIWSQHGGGEGEEHEARNMDYVFRRNHTFKTGGSGITPGRTYNCLLEHNTFEYPGSDLDSRMAKRGSGAWFFGCRNVLAQHNVSKHARGDNDSYGMHIDFGNKNVILQYNYSEDSEGGFCEILGDNINSCYRYNVSVNDGFRGTKGNSIWVSKYSTSNTRSDFNYVYNNTIYVDAAITPDIDIESKNTYIYNNVFYAVGSGRIGDNVSVVLESGSQLNVSNNLFYGNVSNELKNLDTNPYLGNPLFVNAGTTSDSGYPLLLKSPALDRGLVFPEPEFPMEGTGIFADVTLRPTKDYYGNLASATNAATHLGAFNGVPETNDVTLSVTRSADDHVGAGWVVGLPDTEIDGYTAELIGSNYAAAESVWMDDAALKSYAFSSTGETMNGVRLTVHLLDGSRFLIEEPLPPLEEPPPLEPLENLMPNGGFEEVDLSDWNTWNNGIESSDVYAGTYSGRINNGAGSLKQTVTLLPYYRYQLSAVAKLNALSDVAILRLAGHDDLATVVTVSLDATSFKNYQIDFATGSNPSAVEISIYKSAGGQLVADDFVLLNLGPDVSVDSDFDTLPDGWELATFGDLESAGATSDFDLDGDSDVDEYVRGTDASLASSRYQMTTEWLAGDQQLQVTFETIAGRTYIFETAADLSGNWAEAERVGPVSQAGTLQFSLSYDSGLRARFARLRVVPPTP